jgi:cell division transport system permease protein
MPVSVAYVAKETNSNLFRNLLMTIAAMLTVAVSLSLVGVAMLLRQGQHRLGLQWKGGVELSVFLKPTAEQSQIDAVGKELDNMPEVKKADFINKEAAFEEFKEIVDTKDINDVVTANDLPTSYRVVPTRAELVDSIGERFTDYPGVEEVVYAREVIEQQLNSISRRQVVFLVFATVVLGSALVLILNTIQLAIFARRREIAVMKLVGATNWFIRLPFMLEGMVQGLIGAVVAFIVVYSFRSQIMELIVDTSLDPLNALGARASDAVGTGIFLLIVGAFVGALGSAIAVRRFLDV